MLSRAKILKRREELNAYRQAQHKLARLANKPDGDEIVNAIARATRTWEKKRLFGLSARNQNESL